MSLFDYFKIGKYSIKNKILVPPFSDNQAERNGRVSQQIFKNLLRVAKQGAGVAIIGSAYISQQGRASNLQLGISDEEHLPGLKNMVRILKESGMLIGIRLSHAGAKTNAKLCGETPIGPSHQSLGKDYDACREFDEHDVKEVCTFFAHAAERAEEADIDLIEINASQDFLLDQCINPYLNNRDDEYGGDINNRMRLPLEIIRTIKSRINKDILISFFFSNPLDRDEYEAGNKELADILNILEKEKVDFVHPDFSNVMNKLLEDQENMLELTAKHTKLPIIVDGNIKSTAILKELLKTKLGTLYCLDKSLFIRQNWYQFLHKKMLV